MDAPDRPRSSCSLALLVAIVLAVAACGSGGDDDVGAPNWNALGDYFQAERGEFFPEPELEQRYQEEPCSRDDISVALEALTRDPRDMRDAVAVKLFVCGDEATTDAIADASMARSRRGELQDLADELRRTYA